MRLDTVDSVSLQSSPSALDLSLPSTYQLYIQQTILISSLSATKSHKFLVHQEFNCTWIYLGFSSSQSVDSTAKSIVACTAFVFCCCTIAITIVVSVKLFKIYSIIVARPSQLLSTSSQISSAVGERFRTIIAICSIVDIATWWGTTLIFPHQ